MRMFTMLAVAGALAVSATTANAATVVATLPDFNGPSNPAGSAFPINLGTIGTFTFAIPTGATITSALLSGTYGTPAASTSTAAFDASVDGTTITVCAVGSSTCFGGGAAFRPFSFALPSTVFASLLDGSAALAITQTSNTFVRFGSPTLTINYDLAAGVPEPATWALMLLGFGAIGYSLRRRTAVCYNFA